MVVRLAGQAASRIDAILKESARRWGADAAWRYHLLIFAAIAAIGENPDRAGASPVPRVPGLRSWHLRLARQFVESGQRVHEPRHLIVYRVAPRGLVEILSLVHDRMDISRAARQARRAADS